MFTHYIDLIPFLMGSTIVLIGASKIAKNNMLAVIIIITTVIYLLAQSAWFSAFLAGSEWGRDWGNYVWFAFNTSTMGIFGWILIKLR